MRAWFCCQLLPSAIVTAVMHILGRHRNAAHERRRSHLRFPDSGRGAVRLRDLRTRQRRAARRAVGAAGQDQAGLAAPRADRRAHGGRLLSRRAQAGRHPDLLRSGLLQSGHGHGSASADSSAFYAITANVPTSQFNRGPFQESHRNQAAEFPQALRPYVKRTFQPTRVDMLPLALRQSYNLMLTGRPGPVNLDVPFNLFQEEDDVEILRSDQAAGFARPGRCARGCQARRRHDPGGRASGVLREPRRDARRGGAGADAGGRDARHPGHHLSPTGWARCRCRTVWRWASSAATAPIRRTRSAATAIC